jgi:hypothetical protein
LFYRDRHADRLATVRSELDGAFRHRSRLEFDPVTTPAAVVDQGVAEGQTASTSAGSNAPAAPRST